MQPFDERHEASGRDRCGGRVAGIRCGRGLKRDQLVCDDCAKGVVGDLYRTGEGRQYMLELLGEDAISEYVFKARKAAEEQRAAQASERATAKAEEREHERGYVVYYVRLGTNHIKIGTTNNLRRRMLELRVVNPADLLATEPGGFKVETQRHAQFDAWRWSKRKEDFAEDPELVVYIQGLRLANGDPWHLADSMPQQ